MTAEELVHKIVALNYEIIVTHGLDGGMGFDWHGLFIHNPFVDPQYGAFDVDPVGQYGDAYTGSIFVTNPASGLQIAQRHLRERASADLKRHCLKNGVDAAVVIEAAVGINVPESGNPLDALADEQVASVWSQVDGTAPMNDRI